MSKQDPVLDIPANFREEDELAFLKDSSDVDKLRSLLEEGEVVYRIVECFHEGSDGVLAATNRRIIFADQRFLSSKVESFLYREIAAIIYKDELVTHTITLAHSTRTFSVERVPKEHGDRFLTFIHQAIGADYAIEGNGHVFKHIDDLLQIEDVPSMEEEV